MSRKKSINTEDYLSLHDCVCSRMYYSGEWVEMEMEWIEVLKNHPDNPKEEAHQADGGRIIFYQPELICGELFPKKKEDRTTVLSSLTELDLKDLEILDFNLSNNETGKKTVEIYGVFSHQNKNYSDTLLKLSYASTVVEIGPLGNKSWFEDYK